MARKRSWVKVDESEFERVLRDPETIKKILEQKRQMDAEDYLPQRCSCQGDPGCGYCLGTGWEQE